MVALYVKGAFHAFGSGEAWWIEENQVILVQQPAIFAPFDKACTAGFDNAPKLIPEIWNVRSVVYGY